jgi:hypothetical protein
MNNITPESVQVSLPLLGLFFWFFVAGHFRFAEKQGIWQENTRE